MDTEAGLITWEDALRGRTGGMPIEDQPSVWAVGASGAEAESPVADSPLRIAGSPTTEPDEEGWRDAVTPTEPCSN